MRTYTYTLGFAAGSTPLPDPSGFSGETADVDASGERDLTGTLHRDWVATKIPVQMQYTNIGWDMCQTILGAVNTPEFEFTYPDPNTGTTRTGTYYVGNRKWDVVWMPADADPADWFVNLSFSVIEY